MASFAQRLTELTNAGFPGLWIETTEPDEAALEVANVAKKCQLQFQSWNCAADENTTPIEAIMKAAQASQSITVYHNLHWFFSNPVVIQMLFNSIIQGKATRTFHCVLSPLVQIPIELQKHMVVIEHDLPSSEQLQDIASNLVGAGANSATTDQEHNLAVDAATGLTHFEAEGAFALSLARSGKLSSEAIWEIKAGTVKKSGLMTLHRNGDSFAKLGGLTALKKFCLDALAPKSDSSVRPKGILLLGVPGTGKSAFAKALGSETNRPTLILDLGRLMGGIVGETEANVRSALKVADAMSPCILFLDEIEKALAGSSGDFQGDSGVKAGMLGTLLTWLNDHTSDVFVVCTANDVSKLPPEFARAERFDGIFFLDLPSDDQRLAIWRLHANQFLAGHKQDFPSFDPRPSDDNWTGAEIRACCRLAALLGVKLTDAAQYVVPVALTAEAKVKALREWASNRCLDAESGGIYRSTKPPTQRTHRRVVKET